jgi:hypothetical protein
MSCNALHYPVLAPETDAFLPYADMEAPVQNCTVLTTTADSDARMTTTCYRVDNLQYCSQPARSETLAHVKYLYSGVPANAIHTNSHTAKLACSVRRRVPLLCQYLAHAARLHYISCLRVYLPARLLRFPATGGKLPIIGAPSKLPTGSKPQSSTAANNRLRLCLAAVRYDGH